MYDSYKPGDTIAKEHYKVTTPEGSVVNYTMTLEKSGAFAYGNETCVSVSVDYPGVWDMGIDTRYCDGCNSPEAFRDWSLEWLKSECRKGCTIERVTVEE